MGAIYLLRYLIAYILSIAILQSYFCIDLKLAGVGFLIAALTILFINSKKIILEKSDIIIISLLALLNAYYTFVELRGAIFFKSSYILILAIVLSKIIFPSVSSKVYLKKIDIIYLVVVMFLVIEYLSLLVFGHEIFNNSLMCDAPGVQGYRSLHNLTSNFLSVQVPGLNSIMMGAQTASQLAVISFIWFVFKYKKQEKRTDILLSSLALFMMILSPSITSILLLLVSLVIIYLSYLSGILKEEIKGFYQLYALLTIVILTVYLMGELMLYKHDSFDHIVNDLIMGHVSGFNNWNIKDILLGGSIEKVEDSFKTTEIMFLKQLSLYGFFGVGVFYISIFYYIFRALSVGLSGYKTMLMPSIIILIVFVLGNIHYFVMFQAGVRELFALHLAYIIYHGSHMKKQVTSSKRV